MFNRIRRMTATCHSGHAAQTSESAAMPLVRKSASTRSGEVPRVPKPKTLGAVLSKRPETQWRRVHGLPGLAARVGKGDLHALDCRDHHRLRAHGWRRLCRRHGLGRGRQAAHVNWDVVAKNLDSVTTLARAGWKKIAG